MARAKLHLFGKPKLTLDGVEHRISRPVVFELFALVVLAGETGVNRADITDVLWSHLSAANARNQLRGTLVKLRADLADLGVLDAFDLGSQVIRLVGDVDCDLTQFLANPPTTLQSLEPFTKRLAETWPAEHWWGYADEVASTLARSFERHFYGDRLIALRPLLERAAASNRASSQLAALLVSTYKQLGDEPAASDAIITFETAWVDRFGTGDIPKLEVITPKIESDEAIVVPPIVSKDHRSVWTSAALLSLAGLAFIAWSFRPKPDRAMLRVSLLEKRYRVVDGVRFSIRKFRLANAFADKGDVSFRPINERDFAARIGKEDEVVVKRDRVVEHIFPVLDHAQDRYGSTAFSQNLSAGFSVVGKVIGTFEPVPGWPRMEDASLLADGTAIIRRMCDHPYGCHHKLWHYYNGVEHSIFPTRTEPQIIVTDSITETTVYGKYSFGRSEGWRYRTFSYDFRNRRFQFLDLPPVVATLTKDVVVCYPEQTTVKAGDYDTKSTGEVWVVNLATGRTKRRRWGPPGRNPSVAFLPPYIVEIQPYTTRSSKLLFFDANLKQQNAFPELSVDFSRIDRLSERMLLLVPFDRKEHVRDFWLVTREDSL